MKFSGVGHAEVRKQLGSGSETAMKRFRADRKRFHDTETARTQTGLFSDTGHHFMRRTRNGLKGFQWD